MSQFSFDLGIRFYYWDYWKNVRTNYQNIQHDTNHNDHNGYTPSQLYIDPKYTSLKDEMLYNKIYSLHVHELKISLTKADKLSNTYKAKSMRVTFNLNNNYHYGIDQYSPIKYSHILSLLLYTDWSELQCKFSKTFRRKHRFERMSNPSNNAMENFIIGQGI